MQEERRKSSRFSIKGTIEFLSRGGSQVKGSGVNLSRSGVLCNTDEEIDPDTRVSVQMDLQSPAGGAEKIECDGVVIRSDEGKGAYDTGISFTSVPEGKSGRLDEFLKSCEISSGDDQFLDVPE
ncbi:PilZ domain-containing protein [Salinispira pacifica]